MLNLTGNDGLLLLFYYLYLILGFYLNFSSLSFKLDLFLFLLVIILYLFSWRKRMDLHDSINSWFIYHHTIGSSAEYKVDLGIALY